MRVWPYTPKTSRDNWENSKPDKNWGSSWKASEKEWKSDERIMKEIFLSKKETKWKTIQYWLDEYNSLDEDFEDFYWPEEKKGSIDNTKLYVSWNVEDIVENKEDQLKNSKFSELEFSDKIWINQKKKDIRFFDLLNRGWELSSLDSNNKLNWNSLLKVQLRKWESEVMPIWIFFKQLFHRL